MPKKSDQMQKICGNCRYHNTYDYPDHVFCFARFSDKENPVVSILYGCDQWENKVQECFCLEDHLRKHKKSTK